MVQLGDTVNYVYRNFPNQNATFEDMNKKFEEMAEAIDDKIDPCEQDPIHEDYALTCALRSMLPPPNEVFYLFLRLAQPFCCLAALLTLVRAKYARSLYTGEAPAPALKDDGEPASPIGAGYIRDMPATSPRPSHRQAPCHRGALHALR